MTPLRFEWDDAKNRSNRRKHGISFEEARTAFLDETPASYLIRITRTTRSGLCF